MASSEITLEAVSSASMIPAADWDACANPGSAYNPFVSHAFFAACEQSNSACPRTGWGPRHLVAKLNGEIVGLVPCYLKSHSQGEYVFDRGWADAYERAGGQYYPKLQASVPFTPASGPRLLVREGYRVALAKDGLDALERLAEELPSVVLSDIEMPRMDGFDLVRNLRGDAKLSHLPVIMITSRIAQKHRDYAAELGVNHYLGKPYSEEELLALIGRYAHAEAAMRAVA